MRFRQETKEWKDNSSKLSKKEQVVVYRRRTWYTRAAHRHVIEKTSSPECPFCEVLLTTKHILWVYKETPREREDNPEPRKRYGEMEQKD
jgi:hypothetical protein